MRPVALGMALLWIAVGMAAPALAGPATITDGTLTYHVDHRFKSFDAVMPATDAELTLDLDPAAPESLAFSARIPLGSFDSGNSLRDEHAAEVLELFLFPEASWSGDRVEILDRVPAEGAARLVRVRVTGPLTLRDVSQTLVAEALLEFTDGGATIQAVFELSLEDLGVHRPGLLGFKIDDTVTVTVNLTVTLR